MKTKKNLSFSLAFSALLTLTLAIAGCSGGGQTPSQSPPTQSTAAPALSSISPNSAALNASAVSVTATGTNFTSASQIEWNGTALTTTFGSTTSLQAQIPVSDLTAAGTFNVTVATGSQTTSAVAFTVNNPAPTLTSISPSSVVAGSNAVTITLTGTNFLSNSVVQWNGAALTTTYQNATSLQAEIPASDLSTVGTASITVQNPAPGGGISNAVTFSIITAPSTTLSVLNIQANDLVWDPINKQIYVSQPSTASSNGNSVTTVDPYHGTIGLSVPAGSEPNHLAISDDSQFLYAALGGTSAIQRFKLPALTQDIQIPLGSNSSGDPNYSQSLSVAPGAPHTTAILLGNSNLPAGSQESIAIFDDATPRPSSVPDGVTMASLTWGADTSAVYAIDDLNPNTQFDTFPVSSAGITFGTSYPLSGRGQYIHFDKGTGYAYADDGQVVAPKSGSPVGVYNTQIPINSLIVPDSSTNSVFILGQTDDQQLANAVQVDYTLEVFDQKNFNMTASMVIPNVSGTPIDLIRWGTSGLAFVTKGSSNAPGQLYILDGGIVSEAVVPDTTTGTTLDLVPTFSGMSPQSATVGSPSIQLAITGSRFTKNSVVEWNGTALSTTVLNATSLQAEIPASNLLAPASVNIAVIDTATQQGSSPLNFTVVPAPVNGTSYVSLSLAGTGMAWDSSANKIYVSLPGEAGPNGNEVAIVDPIAAVVSSYVPAGSQPDVIRVSGDNKYAYVGIDGSAGIQRFNLPAFTPDIFWNLGMDSSRDSYSAFDIQVAPEASGAVAVIDGSGSEVPYGTGGITVYDNGTPRPTSLQGGSPSGPDYDGIQWGADDSTLYAASFDLYALNVNPSGISIKENYGNILTGTEPGIHFDSGTGYLYFDDGQIVNPANGVTLGTFAASGLALPDSTLNRVFILGQLQSQQKSSNFTIQSFDQTHFTPVGSFTIPNLVGLPIAMIRWGTSGLAILTNTTYYFPFLQSNSGMLYIINGSFVSSAGAATPSSQAVEHVQKTWKTPKKFVRPPQKLTENDMH
jgi:hypothetical protein